MTLNEIAMKFIEHSSTHPSYFTHPDLDGVFYLYSDGRFSFFNRKRDMNITDSLTLQDLIRNDWFGVDAKKKV